MVIKRTHQKTDGVAKLPHKRGESATPQNGGPMPYDLSSGYLEAAATRSRCVACDRDLTNQTASR
jgi:hypothetical protein